MRGGIARKTILLITLFVLAIIWGVLSGSVSMTAGELVRAENRQILNLRLARTFLAILAGGGLAVLGATLQALLRNPLAEPYLLGTSNGAGLGAVIAVILGLSSVLLPVAAFIGTLVSIVLVYFISKHGNKLSAHSLILAGVIVSIAFSGLMIFLISICGDEAFNGVLWWLWGSLQVYDFRLLLIVSVIVFAGVGVIFIFSQDLNAISLGEEEAIHLGINTEFLKVLLFLITSLVTGSLVCICGIIGFVGLVIPHMARIVVGPNHRSLLPASWLAGAVFMIFCDVLSRTLFSPMEIPIGVMTAVTGAPVFIALLKRRERVS